MATQLINPKTNIIATPTANVTPEQTAAAKSAGFVDRYAPTTPDARPSQNLINPNENKPFGSGPGSSSPIDTGADREMQRQLAQSSINAIKSRFDEIIKSDNVAKEDLSSRAYLGALAGGRAGAPSGASEQYKATEKGQEQIRKDLTERDNQINEVLSAADARGSAEFEKKRTEYLANQKDAKAEADRLSGNIKATAGDEIKTLSGHGITYDDFVAKYGQTRANQYMKDLGTDETGLKLLFMKDKPEATKAFEKQIGDNYVIGYKDPVTGKVSTETIPLPKTPGKWSVQKIGDELYFVDTEHGTARKINDTSNNPTKEKKTTQQINEENDATNWLARQPNFSNADKEAFKNDETFRAWAINQAKLEKTKTKKGTTNDRSLPPAK